MNLLTVRDLRAAYSSNLVLNGINFQVESGGWLHVYGKNGAGKTTLLNVISTFRHPRTGMILWNDESVRNQVESFRRRMRYIGHDQALFEDLTVRDNWDLYDGLFDLPDPDNNELLSDIPFTSKVKNLSQGQKIRVQLGTVVGTERELILMDEPLESLDDEAVSSLISAIKTLLSDGVIVISTSPRTIEESTRSARLEKGRLLQGQ